MMERPSIAGYHLVGHSVSRTLNSVKEKGDDDEKV